MCKCVCLQGLILEDFAKLESSILAQRADKWEREASARERRNTQDVFFKSLLEPVEEEPVCALLKLAPPVYGSDAQTLAARAQEISAHAGLQEAITQIEFWFGDENLPKDRHLQWVMARHRGWVPISEIAAFKKAQAALQRLWKVHGDGGTRSRRRWRRPPTWASS